MGIIFLTVSKILLVQRIPDLVQVVIKFGEVGVQPGIGNRLYGRVLNLTAQFSDQKINLIVIRQVTFCF